VPAKPQNLFPRNVSQDALWGMETANIDIALGTNHWSQQQIINAVLHPVAGKQMEYMALMDDPDLQDLWNRGFSNKLTFQGIHDIPGRNTCLFVELKTYQKTVKSCMVKLCVSTSLTKKRRSA
jgi:hypothetical protein